MGEYFDLDTAKRLFAAAAEMTSERESEFSKLDAATGDGDHGTAIKAAIAAASSSLALATDLKNGFVDAGFATMSAASGSTSTLWGAFLMGFGDGVKDGALHLDASELCAAFESALSNVRMQTKASVGDKTLMDALIPAVEAMKGASDVKSLLKSAAAAAKSGAEATVSMRAKFGRAHNLGDKSIGHADAGATSAAAILELFAGKF